jgi:hypothetical protein
LKNQPKRQRDDPEQDESPDRAQNNGYEPFHGTHYATRD